MAKHEDLIRVGSQGLQMGAFHLTAVGMSVKGEPSFEEWEKCGAFLQRIEGAVQWWLGDWLNYGESSYGEKYSQALEVTGIPLATLENYAYVAGNLQDSRRREDLSFSVHSEIVGLQTAKEQDRWLAKAADEGSDAYGRAERHYPTMTIDELCALPIADRVEDDAVLFLWVTSPLLSACWPVIEAWGFTYKTSIVWDKVAHNFGHYVSVRHEFLLICTRGSCTPDNPTPMPDSVVSERRSDEHSEKPESFRQLVEQLYPIGRRLELFGRASTAGWTVYGNQLSDDDLSATA